MSPKIFDWHKLHAEIADETFGIPPDVVFEIVEDGELHEVKAHKMILAMVSLPFKTMFYTTEVGDRTSKAIKIEKTTAPAFQIMIDAIYETKSIEESLKGKSVQEVFDVMHLIEQYQIAELAEAIENYLADYPVTDDSVLEIAVEATQYTTLFEKEAKHLLLTCAKFLKPKLKDAESIFNYAAKADQKEVFSILLALMGEIPPTECPNCGYENCQDRKPIKEDEFRHPKLKYDYKEDQWSPLNLEGKKQYDREFLIQLQRDPLSMQNPCNLPNMEIIKDKANMIKKGPETPQSGKFDFMPGWSQGSSERGFVRPTNSRPGPPGGKINSSHNKGRPGGGGGN